MTKSKFNILENGYYQQSREAIHGEIDLGFWDIDETISELAYLTHDYFRYYGKFPSKVPKNIIEDLLERNEINIDKDFILDNYAGSGTSLVEAKLHEFNSVGLDINPFAVLACNVKTYNFDVDQLSEVLNEVLTNFNLISNNNLENIEKQIDELELKYKDLTKWFIYKNIKDLVILKGIIYNIDSREMRDFFKLAYFAIVRRVSTAYDGEVRPHVNPKKRVRDVISAFEKKATEMIQTMVLWNNETNRNISSKTYLCSNIDNEKIEDIISNYSQQVNKELGLVISHPPYLNCFDYIPVYKLKFMWANDNDEIYHGKTYAEIKKMETKSYPARTEKLINTYFEKHKQCYEIMYNNLRDGGYCCIVIGDCTVDKNLFSVHKVFLDMCQEIGFTIDKVIYRSTHYGLGRYAYSHRAEYNPSEENEKKDAIIFLKK